MADADAPPARDTPNKKKKLVAASAVVRSSEVDEVGPSGRGGDIKDGDDKAFRNKEKVLILASRGITSRCVHKGHYNNHLQGTHCDFAGSLRLKRLTIVTSICP